MRWENQVGDTFEWLHGRLEDVMPDATWYIDGSLFDGDRDLGARQVTGFGVVVVSKQNDLVAYGYS